MASREQNATSQDVMDFWKLNPSLRHLLTSGGAKKEQGEDRKEEMDEPSKRHDMDNLVLMVKPAKQEICYSTDHEQRGICLIIHNFDFEPKLHLNKRKHTEETGERIEKVFADMGFTVMVQTNMMYSEMLKMLQRLASMDHTNNDCLILVFLSHGNARLLYSQDRPFKIQRLWEQFTADKAPTLAGKPKLFFIEATDGSINDPTFDLKKATPIEMTQSDSVVASFKTPRHADMLIAQFSATGYQTWHGMFSGKSYLLQVVATFEKERDFRDVHSMITIAIQKFMEEHERSEFQGQISSPFICSTMTFKLFLDPKKKSST